MAREIEPIGRQIATPQIDVGSNNAYAKLGEAAGNISQLVAEKFSEQAAYQSGLAGQLAAEEGRAPKNLLPPFTKATAEYNNAVIKTEARQLINSGRQQILEAFTKASDASTFNEQTPAVFKADLEGIKQGILDNARPENRNMVREQLEELGLRTEVQMLGEAQKYDNTQQKEQFKRDLDLMKEQLDEAIFTGNKAEEKVIRENIAITMKDYGAINQEIKNKLPDISKKIEDDAKIATAVAGYLSAKDAGKGESFLAEFANNKISGLTVEQKYTALNKMLAAESAINQANSQQEAHAKQILVNDIHNPFSPTHIKTVEDLQEREAYQRLTPFQQEQVFGTFIAQQNATLSKSQKIAEALKEISLGRGGAVDKGVIDDMFGQTRAEIENSIGRPLDMAEQFEIVKNIGTNAPKFDRLVNDKLTSMDPISTLEAGRLYSTARLADQAYLINLSGEGKVMGEKMATLLNGTSNPPPEAVKGVINQVLRAKDPDVVERNKQGTVILEKMGPTMFKSLFGAAPDPFLDNGAYAVFREQFLNAYSNAANQDEAVRIAKDGMREWGEDPWFIPGQVGQFGPTRELPLSEGTQAIRNQVILGVNSIVEANNKGLKSTSGQLPMKLVGNFKLNAKLSPEDLIYDTLEVVPESRKFKEEANILPMGAGANLFAKVPQGVEVEVNGIKSQVKLQASAQTKASGENLVYGVFAQDKFGNYNQLSDPRSPDGLAYIVLKDVDKLAPQVFEKRADFMLEKTLNKARDRQMQEAMRLELRRAIKENPLLPNFRKVQIEPEGRAIEKLKAMVKERKGEVNGE